MSIVQNSEEHDVYGEMERITRDYDVSREPLVEEFLEETSCGCAG